MTPNKDNFYVELICIFQSQIEKNFMVLNWANSVYLVYFWANRSVPEFRTLLNRICQSLSSRKYLNIEIDQINQLKRSTFDSLSALNIQISSCLQFPGRVRDLSDISLDIKVIRSVSALAFRKWYSALSFVFSKIQKSKNPWFWTQFLIIFLGSRIKSVYTCQTFIV